MSVSPLISEIAGATGIALPSVAVRWRSGKPIVLPTGPEIGFPVAGNNAFVIESGALVDSTPPDRCVVGPRALVAGERAMPVVERRPTFGDDEPGFG